MKSNDDPKPRRTGFLPKKRPPVFSVVLLLLALLFGAACVFDLHRLSVDKERLAALQESVHTATEQFSEPVSDTEPHILPRYAALAERNPDLFGWVSIAGSAVDYPVMYTPDEPEKYLRRNFDGEYSIDGTPFMDARCTLDSDNLILYGHHMKNGTMFADILRYKDEAYGKKHPVIQFDTLYAARKYEVMAVFYDRVYDDDETRFRYYDFIDADDEADYDDAVRHYKEKSLYDTGVSAQYGDQLLTLSTCSYNVKNGRFVVVARKTSQEKVIE